MEKLLNNYIPNNIITDREIINIKKYKEKLSYLSVQNTSFIKSTFKNCDIVGSKFYNCSFKDISLNNADIISLQTTKCKFINVIFDGTCIEDIDFKDCIFENCSFKNFTMKNCCFTECEFIKFKPYCCLCELNNYIKCTFVESDFSSSFHYQIFSDCKFNKTTTDIELLGYNYGLLLNDQIIVNSTNLTYFDLENNIENLCSEYLEQSLYTNAFILKFNIEYDYNPTVLLLWSEFLEIILKNNIIIKSNELLFIKNVISLFSSKHKIAPLLLFVLNNRLINTINKYPIDNSKIRDDIILLINNIYFDFIKCTQDFPTELNNFSTEGRNLLIEIKYLEKPKMDLSQILNKFGVGYCHQVKTANGSFYEWISCPDNVAMCLEIFLMLLGIAVPIICDSIKTKKNKNKSKKQLKALDLSECTPSNMTINITINNGCQILNNCNFIENNFYGYNNENMQEIKISVEK